MTVLRESPWYQEILLEGENRGLQKGLEQGLEQGERLIVIRLLSRRFGDLSPEVVSQVKALPLARVEALADALFGFESGDDLRRWLSE